MGFRVTKEKVKKVVCEIIYYDYSQYICTEKL